MFAAGECFIMVRRGAIIGGGVGVVDGEGLPDEGEKGQDD